MYKKEKKNTVRNYFVVMLPTAFGVVTSVIGSKDELESVISRDDIQHVAVEDRNLRIHCLHGFATMNSFEVISSVGRCADILDEVMSSDIMPVYCEYTGE